MTHERPTSDDDPGDVGGRLRRLSETLLQSLVAALGSAQLSSWSAIRLAGELKLDKTLVARILRAIRVENPLHGAYLIPGRQGMELFSKALSRHVADGSVMSQATAAVREFDDFVQREIGGRSALETMLTGLVPQARRSTELKSKQGVFRAMARLLGCEARAHVVTGVLHRAADPLRFDAAGAHGFVGFRRLHRRSSFEVGHVASTASPKGEVPVETLDGRLVAQGGSPLLEAFCSQPVPDFEVRSVPGGVQYMLKPQGFGVASEASFIFAEVERNAGWQCRHDDHVWEPASVAVLTPVSILQFDVFVHESLWPKVEPELWILRRSPGGYAGTRDQDYSKHDRLDVLEGITPLGIGTSGVDSTEMPNYPALVRHLCQTVGWNSEEFRGYRCHIRYPVVGTEVCMRFRLPSEDEPA